jgi:hypothetical protein
MRRGHEELVQRMEDQQTSRALAAGGKETGRIGRLGRISRIGLIGPIRPIKKPCRRPRSSPGLLESRAVGREPRQAGLQVHRQPPGRQTPESRPFLSLEEHVLRPIPRFRLVSENAQRSRCPVEVSLVYDEVQVA